MPHQEKIVFLSKHANLDIIPHLPTPKCYGALGPTIAVVVALAITMLIWTLYVSKYKF